MDYQDFLSHKIPRARATGIEPKPMHASMRPDQHDVTAFALRQGCAALFLDTGMGKTFDELEWCKQTAQASNGYALLLTPLAVARQIEREAFRWGYNARVIQTQKEAKPGINICNYDRLDNLDPAAFGSVALDESSILKSFSGATTRALITAFQHHRFRLCATATPAPNDHTELGQHAEFLGQMSAMEMLSRWFINDTSTASQTWRLKGHAVDSFWNWMATWCRCAETPADLGYDNTGFVLPPLQIHKHKVAHATSKAPEGSLFARNMVNAMNMASNKRDTAEARALTVASVIAREPKEAWVVWCDTDYEADCLQKAIPNSVEVRGSHSRESKETALTQFAAGEVLHLITKPSICGYGLNWQHAARMAFVGRSFSYEAWYQAVRRVWRYGQQRPVHVHLMVTDGEDSIGRVLDHKSEEHIVMKKAMARAMRHTLKNKPEETMVAYNPTHEGKLPAWLA